MQQLFLCHSEVDMFIHYVLIICLKLQSMSIKTLPTIIDSKKIITIITICFCFDVFYAIYILIYVVSNVLANP